MLENIIQDSLQVVLTGIKTIQIAWSHNFFTIVLSQHFDGSYLVIKTKNDNFSLNIVLVIQIILIVMTWNFR